MTLEEFQNMSPEEIGYELRHGGRFVIYTWTLSFIVMTQRRGSSEVYFLRRDEWAIKHGWPYLFLSLILGWWGIPWGPIYTIQSIYYAFCGKDVTSDVINHINHA